MDIIRIAAVSDALSVRDVGQLLGDIAHPGGGDRAAELLSAIRAGQLESVDGTRPTMNSRVTRDQFAAWLHRFGRAVDQRGLAWAWAQTASKPSVIGAPAAVHFRASGFRFEGAKFNAKNGGRAFSGTAYAGGVIRDHEAYEGVAFDLASTKFQTPAPLMLDHGKPIGVVRKAVVASTIELEGEIFADLDGGARAVADMADRGLPWQLSVGIWPGRVDTVSKGASVTLNGRSFAGPLTVFRDNRVREVSIVALGADDKTGVELR